MNAAIFAEDASETGREKVFLAGDYNLAATLNSGQSFRWQYRHGFWEGAIGLHWVRLEQRDRAIFARTAVCVSDWNWLTEYLQVEVDFDSILLSFPDDEPMRRSVSACRGLRLLRQDPWECLASFILSSTKQIVQIQQIVARLCERFGPSLNVPPGFPAAYGFPGPERIAAASEADLRACKMGFRAPNLLATAKMLRDRQVDLNALHRRNLAEARAELLRLPGVGAKIANCVLLFAYGFPEAFPVDVWVMRALRQLYFPGRRFTLKRLREFTATHFGPNAGYAQQYLFHYMRTKANVRRTHSKAGEDARALRNAGDRRRAAAKLHSG
jgi:N-glycosylase/DNA lyase